MEEKALFVEKGSLERECVCARVVCVCVSGGGGGGRVFKTIAATHCSSFPKRYYVLHFMIV